MKKERKRKLDISKAGIIGGLLIAMVMGGFILLETPDMVNDIVVTTSLDDNPLDQESDTGESWHTVAVWDPSLTPLGEVADPGGDGTGFASIFLLDYGQDPTDATFSNNATDWENDANVHAYADEDAFSEDCPSEDPFYICIRARFTKAVCYDDGDSQFIGNRTKCTITFSGDEADTITHYGNHTHGATGGGICTENNSANASLWVNFYFDDNDDGYRITDDGSLTVSLIEISAKY